MEQYDHYDMAQQELSAAHVARVLKSQAYEQVLKAEEPQARVQAAHRAAEFAQAATHALASAQVHATLALAQAQMGILPIPAPHPDDVRQGTRP